MQHERLHVLWAVRVHRPTLALLLPIPRSFYENRTKGRPPRNRSKGSRNPFPKTATQGGRGNPLPLLPLCILAFPAAIPQSKPTALAAGLSGRTSGRPHARHPLRDDGRIPIRRKTQESNELGEGAHEEQGHWGGHRVSRPPDDSWRREPPKSESLLPVASTSVWAALLPSRTI